MLVQVRLSCGGRAEATWHPKLNTPDRQVFEGARIFKKTFFLRFRISIRVTNTLLTSRGFVAMDAGHLGSDGLVLH